MKQYTCMIIDDEPVAIRVIEQYLSRLDQYEIVNSSTDTVDALRTLGSTPVDLLLLDIHMPDLSGLDLYKMLDPTPEVILITAHRDHAVEGFNIHAVDYLLKPVSFPRFLQALDRFEKKILAGKPDTPTDYPESLFVTVDRKKKKIHLSDIIYIESMKDYIQIITATETIVTKETTRDFEDRLPSESFLRIHRSFIINTRRIDTVSYDEISLGEHTLPVGRSFREGVMLALEV